MDDLRLQSAAYRLNAAFEAQRGPVRAGHADSRPMPASDQDVSFAVRTLNAIRSNNGRLGGLVGALENIADKLFGAVPSTTGACKQDGCQCLASAIDDETQLTMRILSDLERAVERLRMVA